MANVISAYGKGIIITGDAKLSGILQGRILADAWNANNDDMAVGAIEALQKYGFNKYDKSKYIPFIGVDGSPKAKELIDQGIMTGIATEDVRTQTNAIYSVELNLVSGNVPLSNTNYKFDETGITIKTLPSEYIK
ncbi:substrate-binding domain-containing protein [Clostridium vincentii]|nr:substrate-binding domain-containing protein [Clostridium vincentii]